MGTAFTFMDLTSGRCAGQLAVTSKCWRLWTHREGFSFSLGHRFGSFNSVGPVVKLCMAGVDIKSRALTQKRMWDSLLWKQLEWPWNTDAGHLKLRVPMWKLQPEVWEFYRTEASLNHTIKASLKHTGESIREVAPGRLGKLCSKPQRFLDHILSFGVVGSQWACSVNRFQRFWSWVTDASSTRKVGREWVLRGLALG